MHLKKLGITFRLQKNSLRHIKIRIMILVALGNLFLYLRKDTGLIKCMRLSHQTEKYTHRHREIAGK